MLNLFITCVKRRVLLALLLLAAAQGAWGQGPWYVGVQGGTSFGQGTFRSITEHGIHWGAQGGLFGAYRFNRLLSLELGAQYGGQSQYALDCCPYWMSEDEVRYVAPVLGQNGWYYRDLSAATQWGKAYLQANVDLLSLVTRPGCRWSLHVSPQLSAVTTRTRLVTPDKELGHDRQWHLGYGGQASVGFQISKTIGAALYGGITCLTGRRFDNIPVHAHKSNLLWDAGVKLSFFFGGKKPAQPAAITPAEADDAEREAARLAAERQARERAALEAAEQAERERRERELAAREAAERAAQEAAAAREAALRTPIPTVYFANNSSSIGEAYEESLASALPILEQYPDFQLEIHAYASRSGGEAYNQALSERRMEAVRQWYVARGIAPERIGRSYFHGVDHDAPTADEARRAEIKFVK